MGTATDTFTHELHRLRDAQTAVKYHLGVSCEGVSGRGSPSPGGWHPLTCEAPGGERPGRTSSFSVLELGRPPAPALGPRCSGSQAFRLLLPLHHRPLGLGPSGPAWNWTRGVRRPPAGSQQSLGLLGLHRCQQSLRANVCLEASICHVASAAWRTRSHAGPGSEVPPAPTQEDTWV